MITFTDFSPDGDGLSYWLPPEAACYSCAYFPKEKSEKKTFSMEEAYHAGGSFAFFQAGTAGSGFQEFRKKAEAAISAEGDRSYFWVDDREVDWKLQAITETKGNIEADILLDIGGYDFSLYVSGKSVGSQWKDEKIQFTASLNGQLYPPGDETAVHMKILGIDFSGIKQAGGFLLEIPYVTAEKQAYQGISRFIRKRENDVPGSREAGFWQALRLEMRYFYVSDATLQDRRSFILLPLAESTDSFSLKGQIHPFRPLDIEAAFLKPAYYSKTLMESHFSFADGTPVCFRTSDVTIGFEKSIDVDSGENQFYFSLKGKAMAASRTEGEGKNTFLHDACSPNPLSLLLNLDGGQSLSLQEENVYFHFVDKPSFAAAGADKNGGLAELDGRSMAPWVAVRQDVEIPPEYYRHPVGMCTYAAGQESPFYEGYPERELLASNVEEDAFPLLPNQLAFSGKGEEEKQIAFLESAFLSSLRSQVFKRTGIAPRPRGRKPRGKKLCVTGGFAYMQPENVKPARMTGAERETEELTWLGFGDEDGIAGPGEIPLLSFSHVRGDLKSAFLEGEAFLVMSEEKAVKDCCSLTYRVSVEGMGQIQSCGKITSQAKADLKSYFDNNKSLYDRQFADEASFEEILAQASKALDEEALRAIETICAGFYFVESGFRFSMAPFWWKEKGTVLIFKFRRGVALEELALDASRWSFPAAAGDCLQTKQKLLRAIDHARMESRAGKASGHKSEYEGFLKVVEDPDFTGILALNCPCVNREVPPALLEYANLFSISDLCASYAVITCSHAEETKDGGVRFFSDTQALITCESVEKGQEEPREGFSFTPTELFLQLHNGRITGKYMHASLYLDTLFSESLALAGGGHMCRLCGTGQKQGGIFRYELSPFTGAEYLLSDSPLGSVEIRQVSFILSESNEKTKAVYTLSGRLRFRGQEEFDPYSYGRAGDEDSFLLFSGLSYTVITGQGNEARTVKRSMDSMRVREGEVSPRSGSFAERFPIHLEQLLCCEDNSAKILPKDLSYIGIQAPVKQGVLSKVWYGIIWQADLGACGLSPLKGVRLELLTAWGPAEAGGDATELFPGISEYVGMRLLGPDGKAFSMEFVLFDAIKLKYKTIELKYEKSPEGKKSYWFLFHNFVLQLFALSLPNGSNTLGIYADPKQDSASRKLGWYCVYTK